MLGGVPSFAFRGHSAGCYLSNAEVELPRTPGPFDVPGARTPGRYIISLPDPIRISWRGAAVLIGWALPCNWPCFAIPAWTGTDGFGGDSCRVAGGTA